MSNQLPFDPKSIHFGQRLRNRLVHSIDQYSIPKAGSSKTAYRRLNSLKSMGLVNQTKGKFDIKTGVISQPLDVIMKLLDSLLALKDGRRFGKYYNNTDIRFVKENLEYTFITLDYKAWELTRFQYPLDLYVYVKDLNSSANYLKQQGYGEGDRGRVILLQEQGDFSNAIERVYLDCIANDGRSILDAIAIDILYGEKINVKGHFTTEDFRKVFEDLPANQYATPISK